jgi:uncharacterized protein
MPGPFRLLLTLLIVLLIDLYFFQSLKTVMKKSSAKARKIVFTLYWSLTVYGAILTLISIMVPMHQWPDLPRVYGFGMLMIPLLCKLLGCIFLLIDDLIRLGRIAWKKVAVSKNDVDKKGEKISRTQFLSRTALAVAAVPFATLMYGMMGTAFDFKVRRIKLHLPKLPAGFEGLKIVQISDIHCGSFVSDEPFLKALKMIDELKPDIIFFTGDLVNNQSEEAEKFNHVWRSLKAPMGVFSTLGNHDYGDYIQWDSQSAKQANFNQLIDLHKRAGWDLLMNEHRVLERNGDKIAVIGVENWGGSMRFPKYGDIEKAGAGTEDYAVKILLSHDPSHWDAQVRKLRPDIDLTFSGHTHGMQFGIEIPGFKWSPSQYLYKQWAGLYEEGHQKLYVNRGLGFLGYPGRVGIFPEITLVELSGKA